FTTYPILYKMFGSKKCPPCHITVSLSLWQVAEEDNNVEETCNITISGTVSLACVKEEPTECEVTPIRKLLEESKSVSYHFLHVKQEKNECTLSPETCIQGSDQPQIIQSEGIKSEIGCSDLDIESKDDKEKPFSCSHCGEKFRNKGVLMQHESNHIKEGKIRTYHCSQCGKSFALRAFLKAHQKLHENVESTLMHSCTLCPRRFRYKGSLAAHMRHHTSQVTYNCPVCEEAYQLKAALCQHIRTSHSGSRLSILYFQPANFVLRRNIHWSLVLLSTVSFFV
uniref:C2H2-type domain-containing protein n=1 Tax=Electrophorus electricus TaxID=8005 RepID=A0A4W4FVR6_ELEEL